MKNNKISFINLELKSKLRLPRGLAASPYHYLVPVFWPITVSVAYVRQMNVPIRKRKLENRKNMLNTGVYVFFVFFFFF